MNRRQFIGGTAAISLAAATTLANAHGNHDHGSHSHAATVPAMPTKPPAKLQATALLPAKFA